MSNRRSCLNPMRKRKLISFPEVLDYLQVCRGTLYRWIKDGNFTPPFTLGSRKKYWYQEEIIELVHLRASSADDDSINDLVTKQLASRQVITNAN